MIVKLRQLPTSLFLNDVVVYLLGTYLCVFLLVRQLVKQISNTTVTLTLLSKYILAYTNLFSVKEFVVYHVHYVNSTYRLYV